MGECDRLQIAKETYARSPAPYVLNNTHRLISATPTLKIYKRVGETEDYVVGVRGTHSAEDLLADAALVVGALRHTSRFKRDRDAFTEFLAKHPTANVQIVGHSLGGAIVRELTREFPNRIAGGTTFNSAYDATQLRDDVPQLSNVFSTSDPLGILAPSFESVRYVRTNHFDPLSAHAIRGFMR